jgi:hypothetical protein
MKKSIENVFNFHYETLMSFNEFMGSYTQNMRNFNTKKMDEKIF